VKLIFFMASAAHWGACFWHLIYILLLPKYDLPGEWTFEQLGNNSAQITYFLFA
jgi:hypothetical protein